MVRGRCPDVCPPAFRRLPPHSLRACLLFLGQVGVEFEAAVGVPGRPDMSPFLRSSRAHPQNLSPLSALPSLQVPVLAREGRTRDRQMAAALLTAWSQVSVPIQGWRESRRTWGGRTSDWTILQIYGPDMGLAGTLRRPWASAVAPGKKDSCFCLLSLPGTAALLSPPKALLGRWPAAP